MNIIKQINKGTEKDKMIKAYNKIAKIKLNLTKTNIKKET